MMKVITFILTIIVPFFVIAEPLRGFITGFYRPAWAMPEYIQPKSEAAYLNQTARRAERNSDKAAVTVHAKDVPTALLIESFEQWKANDPEAIKMSLSIFQHVDASAYLAERGNDIINIILSDPALSDGKILTVDAYDLKQLYEYPTIVGAIKRVPMYSVHRPTQRDCSRNAYSEFIKSGGSTTLHRLTELRCPACERKRQSYDCPECKNSRKIIIRLDLTIIW